MILHDITVANPYSFAAQWLHHDGKVSEWIVNKGATGLYIQFDFLCIARCRKASVRLGSFRFVETSNRGGSVHQQAGSFRFA